MNEGFTPSGSETAQAVRCVEAFEWARAARQPSAEVEGVLVDAAAADGYRALLAWADACKERDGFKARAVERAQNREREAAA
jgi:citrate lyase beta subunit